MVSAKLAAALAVAVGVYFLVTPTYESLFLVWCSPHDDVDRIPVPSPSSSAVFITGCSSGIGRHAAITLACEGYLVFAGVRVLADGDSLRGDVASQSCKGSVVPVMVDVTKEASVTAAVTSVKAHLAQGSGRSLAAVINNAGVAHVGAIETIPLEKVR